MAPGRGKSMSLAQAMEYSDDGRFICTAEYPYGILYANKSFTKVTDYQQHEIEGKDLCFMQGSLTDSVSLKHMMKNVQLTGHGKASLINYTKGGKPFRCEVIIQPIFSKDMYGDELITHLLGVLIKTSNVEAKNSPSTSSTSSAERSEQEGTSDWTAASTSDTESGSVSSWNSTSENEDNNSRSPCRDSGDDSSEEVSCKSSKGSESKPSAKRPRLDISNLLSIVTP